MLELVSARLALIDDVARAKWNAKAPVSDPRREREFLREMANEGKALGLDPAATEAFFAAQIDAAKEVQNDRFREWAAAKQPPFPDAPDLKRDVRPKIDRVSRELLAALAAYRAGPYVPPDTLSRLADETVNGPNVTPDVRAAAIRPLLSRAR